MPRPFLLFLKGLHASFDYGCVDSDKLNLSISSIMGVWTSTLVNLSSTSLKIILKKSVHINIIISYVYIN